MNEKNTRLISVGVDIGGSHITASAIDLSTKRLISGSWMRRPVDSLAEADEILDTWAEVIRGCMESARSKYATIGIAMPGPMDYKNGVCLISDQQKYNALYGMNIGNLLANRLDVDARRINFRNDAACYLQGELFSGSLCGYKRAIGLTLGSGLGTSHTFEGAVVDSELWNMPFLGGIAEDYLSSRWFIERFREICGHKILNVKDLVEGYHGTPPFLSLFSEFSINLALFIFKFINKTVPQAVVIGGNIANADVYFMELTRKYLTEMLGYSIPIRKSALGETAAMIGAAAFDDLAVEADVDTWAKPASGAPAGLSVSDGL